MKSEMIKPGCLVKYKSKWLKEPWHGLVLYIVGKNDKFGNMYSVLGRNMFEQTSLTKLVEYHLMDEELEIINHDS